MSEFKFLCPSCGQKIEVDAAAAGRQFDCPSCRAKLTIPAAPVPAEALDAATSVPSTSSPPPVHAPAASSPSPPKVISSPVPNPPAEAPAQPPLPRTAAADHAATAPPKVPAGTSGATVFPPPLAHGAQGPSREGSGSTAESPAVGIRVQIASLTPVIKREIIRSVRKRLADEAHWMPRITSEREYAYAAKEVEGRWVPVPVTSREATRFSILGALLLEFHLRHVTQTAAGRQELLGQELLDAIREVAGVEAATQEAAPDALLDAGKLVPPVSHAQSMQVLDVLEERYSEQARQSRSAAQGRQADLRLSELSLKIERKNPVTIEELCSALANELREIDERLNALERPPVLGD